MIFIMLSRTHSEIHPSNGRGRGQFPSSGLISGAWRENKIFLQDLGLDSKVSNLFRCLFKPWH